MRVAVTGAGSQLTAPLSVALERAGHVVTALTHAQLDICDLDAVGPAVTGHDAVVNLAAANSVDGCEQDPMSAYEGNTLGPMVLARAARDAGAQFVTFSSDFVHGGLPDPPDYLDEAVEAIPVNVYGHSKLLGEEAVDAVGGRAYVLRTSWVVGERFLDGVRANIETGKVALPAGGHACPAIAQDLCEVVRILLEGDAPYGLYNVVNPPRTERPALLEAIVTELGGDPSIVSVGPDTRPAPRPAYSPLAVGKLASVGIEMPPWRDSLHRFVAAKPSPLAAL